MKYRLHGQDGISKEPRGPLDIEADTEEAAREQATQEGMEVLRVEHLQLFTAEPPLPRTAPVIPLLEGRSLPDPTARPPRGRWLLACLGLVPVSLAAGLGIGLMVPRFSHLGSETALSPTGSIDPVSTGSSTSPTARPAGIRIERLELVEELFDLAGQRAVVLKYSGGEVKFWIEMEAQGKKQKFWDWGGEGKQPGPNQRGEGYFLWVRNEADDAGREWWRIGHRYDLITGQTSGTRVSAPLVETRVSHSKEERQSRSEGSSQTVQVWKGKDPGGRLWSTKALLSNPVPTDRDVCIREITEERKRFLDKNADAAASASTLGLQSSPLGGPLLAASAMIPKTTEAHTIRVMCRAVSKKEKPTEVGPSAK